MQDKCSPNDTYICKNAGVCKITKTGAASCTCNKEYAGESCEVGKYIFNPNAICYILSILSTISYRELINAFNNQTDAHLRESIFVWMEEPAQLKLVVNLDAFAHHHIMESTVKMVYQIFYFLKQFQSFI